MDIKIVECPRDAIQGMASFIPTQKKIDYINLLIKSNLFDCIDFGSFVSPKAVPQMADTPQVVEGLELINNTKLLAIIVNERGATDASSFEKISKLGYPFSISETFQLNNTKKKISDSLEELKRIRDIAYGKSKDLVVYISMAFGNPYGDIWSEELVLEYIELISDEKITQISLADTTSEGDSVKIAKLFDLVKKSQLNIDIGLHLHTNPIYAQEKIDAAYNAGCRTFDSAILGYGGCPFAKDELVGNLPTEYLLNKYTNIESLAINQLQNHFLELINKP